MWLPSDIFNTNFTLSFKCLGSDTCDVCDSYLAHLKCDLSEEDKEKLKFDYDTHLQEAQQTCDEKSSDTTAAKNKTNHNVITGDLQKCLPTPLLSNTESLHKRKLWRLNFTLYHSSDGPAQCVM
jgi:hypothetical protein